MTLSANMGGPMQQEALEGVITALQADCAQLTIQNAELVTDVANARNNAISEVAQKLRDWAEDLRQQASRTAVPGAEVSIMAQANRLSLAAADVAKMVTEVPAPASEDRLEMIL